MMLKYRNVTVSGLPGAGSSTLARAVAKKLGWKYFSGGEYTRAWAVKKGLVKAQDRLHHTAILYSDSFDRKVDMGMRRRLRLKDHQVMDAFLSGFVAQGVPGVLKVKVQCSRTAVRVDRMVNRDQVGVKEAKKHLFDREGKNLTKWRRLYKKEWRQWVGSGEIDFYNDKLYDLVIDTYSSSREESLRRTLDKLGYVESFKG